MIRVDRSAASVPERLAADLTAEYAAIRAHVEAGTLTPKHFSASLYGHRDVKRALWDLQHHKCCFCEGAYESVSQTVEHYRPKTSARDADGTTAPGYWWLAYAYDNLFFCCNNCNSNKSDWFPVRQGTRRLRHPDLAIGDGVAEQPMILSPTEDTTAHLTFLCDAADRWRIAPTSDRGEATIRYVALDRDDLTALRDQHVRRWLAPFVPLLHQRPDLVQQLVAPNVPFSLLNRAVLTHANLL